MREDRLTPSWKLGGAVCALLIIAVLGWLSYTWAVLGHDKSINTQLAILRENPKGVPLGLVQPSNNRWMKEAFLADAPSEDGKKIALLILDDHFRGGDPAYRSESGVIGDRISKPVLCSVPAQARTKNVLLDPAVRRLIVAECR
jgi:hypothetical protein